MKCPQCHGEANKIPWHQGTSGDKGGAVRSSISLHRGHPVLGLAGVAWLGVKMAFSTAWRCSKCSHEWRTW